MFEIKIFQASNASLVESRVFDNIADALENYNATGSGEGYWVELREAFDGYTITRFTTA
jgi:hypothetical protein